MSSRPSSGSSGNAGGALGDTMASLTVHGSRQDDQRVMENGVNTMTLQAGGNTDGAIINGGIDRSGQDVLIGGSGNDTAVFFKSNTHGAHDFIADFNPSKDSVVLLVEGAVHDRSPLFESASRRKHAAALRGYARERQAGYRDETGSTTPPLR